ncbi:MAG: CerR family C-terminal domain-containing protein [Planctomycetes bacterium]|nr:CerR family C-terminal domain-containing protein [Planctomycetota bacterium]
MTEAARDDPDPRDHRAAPGATRDRLIRVAGALFAERGFARASVRDICARAAANVAAVRYHFGSKEALYREVLLGSHRELRDREPIPRLADFRRPTDALRAWLGFVLRFLLLRRPAHSYAGQLIARELEQPTAALTDLVRLVMQPVRTELEHILGALLGDADSPARRAQLANFALGLCVFHEFGRPVLERFGHPPPTDEPGVDALADALASFIAAGTRALRHR